MSGIQRSRWLDLQSAGLWELVWARGPLERSGLLSIGSIALLANGSKKVDRWGKYMTNISQKIDKRSFGGIVLHGTM
jgi:hypothetical protein